MSKAEEKYKYLLNRDKYDPDINKAVDKKNITHREANKVHAIQEMMRKEKELQSQKKSKNMADYVGEELSKKYNK